MNNRPNIVENQFGLSDITQSIDMKVTAKAQKIRPGPLMRDILRCATRGPSRSSTTDQRFRYQPRKIQPPNITAARTNQNGRFRKGCLCCSIGLAFTISGLAQG